MLSRVPWYLILHSQTLNVHQKAKTNPENSQLPVSKNARVNDFDLKQQTSQNESLKRIQ